MSNFEAIRRLREEYTDLIRNPIIEFCVTVSLINEQDLFKWYCIFIGSQDTPYKEGIFRVKLTFPQDYPSHPPKIKFITPIYHINVLYKNLNSDYEVGTPSLRILDYWRHHYKVRDILISIFSLFYMHNIECIYNQDFVSEVTNNKNLYNDKIRYFTQKYANIDSLENNSDTNQNSWDFSYNV